MPRLVIDEAEIHYDVAGAGSPLALLHGFTGSAAGWAPHMLEFASRHLTVAIDLIGHGLSDAPTYPERYGIAHYIEDVLGVLDHLEIRRTGLLGYSMGGRVALALAITAPERFTALILESTSPGLRDHEIRRDRSAQDAALADAIERDGVEAFADRWEQLPLFRSQTALPEEVRSALRAQRLQNHAAGLAGSLRGIGQGVQPPMHDFLPGLRVPTLILAGSLDPQYSELGHEMSRDIPGACLEIVQGAGHAIHLEQPAAFHCLVLEFLARVSQPAH
ncbi:MAG: 2-succinyl-6-hydroxy-2,4-cyclohexadiene-1-carboxylate synthase [Armatimonadota bacterium]